MFASARSAVSRSFCHVFRYEQRKFAGSFAFEKFGFPVIETAGKKPEVIFCHALGAACSFPLPIALESYVTKRHEHAFVRFQYRFFGDTQKIWHVDNWVEDIVTLLDRHDDEKGSILFACSGGAQAALRAALERPEKVHSLLLICPGVGLTLDYMNRVNPGSLESAMAGETVYHPALNGVPPAPFNLQTLIDFQNRDPLNVYGKEKIPLECPVSILHGMRDFLVPFQNSIKLMSKLKSKEVDLKLMKNETHIMDMTPEMLTMVDKALEGKNYLAEELDTHSQWKTSITGELRD